MGPSVRGKDRFRLYDEPVTWRRRINRIFPWATILFLAVGLWHKDWFALLVGALGLLGFSILLLAQRFRPTLLYKPRPPTAARRLDELDAKLTPRNDVEANLARGHRIRAVKLYRDATGATLGEALDAIERLDRSGPCG